MILRLGKVGNAKIDFAKTYWERLCLLCGGNIKSGRVSEEQGTQSRRFIQ